MKKYFESLKARFSRGGETPDRDAGAARLRRNTASAGKIIAWFLVLVASIWTLTTVVERMQNEKANGSVELCVSWDEIVDECHFSGYPLNDFLERCRAIGVTSMALNEDSISSLVRRGKLISFPPDELQRLKMLDVLSSESIIQRESFLTSDPLISRQLVSQLKTRYDLGPALSKAGKFSVISPVFGAGVRPYFWNDQLPAGFSDESLEYITNRGFKAVLSPQNVGDPQWLFDLPTYDISGIIFDGREIPGFPGAEPAVADWFKTSRMKYVIFEFNTAAGQGMVAARSPEQLILGHAIAPAELYRNQDPGFWLARWVKAVRERGNRFLYVRFWPHAGVERNLAYLRSIAQNLKKDGYRMAPAEPPGYPLRGNARGWLILILIAAVIFPLIALGEGKNIANPFLGYLAINAITIFGGVVIAALGFDLLFMQKIVPVPGVKMLLLLPLVASIAILFSPREIKKIVSAPVVTGQLLAFGLAAAALAVLLLRSGNISTEWLQPDQGMRHVLEQLFSVRPRTKEFLIGQPFLFAGLYFRKPLLLWIGMIGQVSIVNTFLHLHTPVSLSLMRTFHGLWLGLLIGCTAVYLYEWLTRRKESRAS